MKSAGSCCALPARKIFCASTLSPRSRKPRAAFLQPWAKPCTIFKSRCKMETINLKEKFSRFSDYANPRIMGKINDRAVKTVKRNGEFIWHPHAAEDELFPV